MQVDFSNNYFELFGCTAAFAIDEEHTAQRYRELQKVLHPDRFATKSDSEKRWSMQAASFVNEAYQTLSKPLSRAIYLLSINGINTDEETDTQMPGAFLMQQMEWREALEEAPSKSDPFAALDDLAKELKSETTAIMKEFEQNSTSDQWQEARGVVRRWQFLDKMRREVQAAEAALDA
ncbi:MAG: Fe-S protein assembly co-chaperone HscB [Gammaproteobacteria bacterium]|nr:Fe-S protein assembly co-chaperone HscB [Gammaproteobacteria bacterium]